jgi:putative peptidoglycan lipid II flippase
VSERLTKSAGLIGLATLGSRILGLVRDQAQAFFFGTNWQADAFVVATRIPGLLRELFAEGAMSAAFVPTLTRTLTKEGKDAAWRLGSQVVNGLLVVTGILVLLGVAFAEPLTRLFADENFINRPGTFQLTVMLTRWNMPFLMLIAVAAAFMGMLNSLRKFFIPSISPAMFNVVFIVATITLVPLFRRLGMEPTMALSIGMLGGGLAQIVSQWPTLRREGYRHQWILNPRDPVLRDVLVLMGPGTLGVAAAQINLLVNTWLATSVEGAPAALRFAFQLMYLPIGIFGVSVATATIPDLARHAAEGAHDAMIRTVSWAIRLMIVLSIPAIVGLVVLSGPIVEMIYRRGAFNAQSALMTAGALAFYAPGILGYSIVKIASPSFYSLREARTPVIVSLITIAVNLVLNLWLNSIYGFRGLALGTAIAANVNAVLLVFLLARRLGGGDGARIGRTFAKTCLAAAVMGVAAYYSQQWLHGVFNDFSLWHRVIRVAGAIGISLGVLALMAHLLRLEEFSVAVNRILARFRQSASIEK